MLLGCEKNPCPSNPIPYRKYLHLSKAAFVVKLTAPSKKVSSARKI